MKRSIQWISMALGAVLVITLSARTLGGEQLWPESWQVNVLSVDEGPETLMVTDHESPAIQIGSLVDVHHFELNMAGPYTLRYLTFMVELTDLKAEDWVVYEMDKGDINYAAKVGQGESFKDGKLKLRFSSGRSYGYYGEGKQDFALVANLSRTGENPSITIQNTDQVDWVEGVLKEPWGL